MTTRIFALRSRTAGCLVVAACFSQSAFARPTIIDFDNVRDKTEINTLYQALGVTFSCDGGPCGVKKNSNHVYARTTPGTASSPNSVSPVALGSSGVSDTLTGRVVAKFASGVTTVTIDAKAVRIPEPLNQTAYAQIVAYNSAGAVVATAVGNQLNTFQTLMVTAAPGTIAKVSLGVTGPAAAAVFDNLTFDQQKIPFPLGR